jgi:pimeloyl-ACP methyl ester carboxylesterase
VSTPRTLELPDGARRVTIKTSRGAFAALEALPATGVCERSPALLVPGFTGSKEDFLSVIGLLANAGRRVIAIDMRGQYETAAADDADGYALSALAADVALIADEVAAQDGDGQHRIHLMGHSFGGLVAREVVLTGAARTSSLTLMSSGPGALTGPRTRCSPRSTRCQPRTSAGW